MAKAAIARELCAACHALTVVDGVCTRCPAPSGDAGEFNRAPLRAHPPTHTPVTCVQDFYAKLLRGADDALEAVLAGNLGGRELLAYSNAASVMIKAAKELERDEHRDDPAQVAAEIDRLQRELAKR